MPHGAHAIRRTVLWWPSSRIARQLHSPPSARLEAQRRMARSAAHEARVRPVGDHATCHTLRSMCPRSVATHSRGAAALPICPLFSSLLSASQLPLSLLSLPLSLSSLLSLSRSLSLLFPSPLSLLSLSISSVRVGPDTCWMSCDGKGPRAATAVTSRGLMMRRGGGGIRE